MTIADERIAAVPASCTCTWEHSKATGYRWQRVTPKRDCPWHTWEEK